MKKRLRSLSIFFLSIAVAFSSFGLVSLANAGISPQEQKLVRAAKKEGAVTIINPLFSDRTAKRMQRVFIKRYGLGNSFRLNNIRKGNK